MKLLLIGNGRWGKNYIKTISDIPNIMLDVADRSNWHDKINEHPGGVIIAASPQSHIEIADYALSKNIPSMIEKPLSLSLKEAEQLKQYKTPVLVNHIHLFSDAYQNIKQIIKDKKITQIYSAGIGVNPPRDYSTLWDYAPHDLALILDLLQEEPQSVSIFKDNWKDIFDIKMTFDGCLTQSIVGIDYVGKYRSLQVEFDGMYVGYDDAKRPVDHRPPLLNAVNVFIGAINGKDDPRLGIDLSLKILQILEHHN